MSSFTQSAKFRIRQIEAMVGTREPAALHTGERARNKKGCHERSRQPATRNLMTALETQNPAV